MRTNRRASRRSGGGVVAVDRAGCPAASDEIVVCAGYVGGGSSSLSICRGYSFRARIRSASVGRLLYRVSAGCAYAHQS